MDFQEMIILKRRWRESRDKPLPVILIIARAKYNRPVDDIWLQLYGKSSEGIITVVITIPECSTNDAYSWQPVRDRTVNVLSAAGLDNVVVELGKEQSIAPVILTLAQRLSSEEV
ncbi:hypothetical protein TESG_04693 [Trichophyton tonsurans CBS 112818]|uniref:Uncharacterized protein n=1 Tax=Trichophyton tonsurans (strain CBS 112818) TaxID=647933 RepID=F2S133_TRIT1|nr:hypothetical protein TESG_04693 [Trichophyton tonsurans CBS 112818]